MCRHKVGVIGRGPAVSERRVYNDKLVGNSLLGHFVIYPLRFFFKSIFDVFLRDARDIGTSVQKAVIENLLLAFGKRDYRGNTERRRADESSHRKSQ